MVNDMEVMRNGQNIATIINKRFCKFGLFERRHLLWSLGGVPALDADTWDTYKDTVDEIYVQTERRTFKMDAKKFHQYKEAINYGYGKQYTAPLKLWEVTNRAGVGASAPTVSPAQKPLAVPPKDPPSHVQLQF